MNKDAVNNIGEWLNGHKRDLSDYHTGLMLLESYSDDKQLLEKLKKYKSASLLFDSLVDLWNFLSSKVEQQTKTQEVKEIYNEVAVSVQSSPSIKLNAKNSIISKLNEEWKALRKKSGAWQVMLFSIGRTSNGIAIDLNSEQKDQRAVLANQIMDNEKRIAEIWADIDYVSIHGFLPTREKPTKKKSKVEFDYKTYENTRKYIGTAKKTIEDLKKSLVSKSGDDLVKTNKKIDKWEVKLAGYNTLFEKLKKLKP